MTTPTARNIAQLTILDRLRGIALEGLKYTKDPYDQRRYEHLLELATADYSALLDIDATQLIAIFKNQIGTTTPKTGADAAVINDKNQLLILKRNDDKLWCIPCGWIDVGESPAQAAQRETLEETGLVVEPLYYIGLSHKGPHTAERMQHQISCLTLMKPVTADATVTLSHEHTDYRWISESECADIAWHPGMQRQAETIFAFLQSDRTGFVPVVG